jgi:hypothetical protein
MIEICKNCEMRKIHHLKTSVGLRCPVGSTNFVPSGRVSVEFIEAVKKLVYGQGVRSDKVDDIHKRHLRYLLDQMEGGGK